MIDLNYLYNGSPLTDEDTKRLIGLLGVIEMETDSGIDSYPWRHEEHVRSEVLDFGVEMFTTQHGTYPVMAYAATYLYTYLELVAGLRGDGVIALKMLRKGKSVNMAYSVCHKMDEVISAEAVELQHRGVPQSELLAPRTPVKVYPPSWQKSDGCRLSLVAEERPQLCIVVAGRTPGTVRL